MQCWSHQRRDSIPFAIPVGEYTTSSQINSKSEPKRLNARCGSSTANQQSSFCCSFLIVLVHSFLLRSPAVVAFSRHGPILRERTPSSSSPRKVRRNWEENYSKLREYKEKYGDCYKADMRLAVFVSSNRQRARAGTLSGDRRVKLEELGFSFDPFGENWDKMLQQLKDFYKKHGYVCEAGHGSLGRWVTRQRLVRESLSESQRAQLDELDFVWEEVQKATGDPLWTEKFERLEEFRDRFGYASVPRKWKCDPSSVIGYTCYVPQRATTRGQTIQT